MGSRRVLPPLVIAATLDRFPLRCMPVLARLFVSPFSPCDTSPLRGAPGPGAGGSPSRSYAYDADDGADQYRAGKGGRSGRETDTAEKREKYLSLKGLAPQNMQLALWIDRAAIVALPLGYLIQLKAMWSQLS